MPNQSSLPHSWDEGVALHLSLFSLPTRCRGEEGTNIYLLLLLSTTATDWRTSTFCSFWYEQLSFHGSTRCFMSFSLLWIDTTEVKLTQNVTILFPSILCNLLSELTFHLFKGSLWFLLTSLRALSVMSNSFPNYLLQMQTSPPTIKLFDLKRLGDYGRRQFSTCFNDFVSLTL